MQISRKSGKNVLWNYQNESQIVFCGLLIQTLNITILPVNYIEPKKIATDFDKELKRIKTKFCHAGYPVKFINDIFFRFNKEEQKLLILKWIFDETKLVVIRLPFALRNEKFSKRFMSKLQTFTNGKVRFNIICNTCKIQSLFIDKDKVQHLSCVIYKSVYSCDADYIGEIIRSTIFWARKNSECFKHLQEHLSHGFQWSVLSIAPSNTLKRNILEAYFIKMMLPSLNSQMNNDVLTLFRNGITDTQSQIYCK